MKYIFVCKHGQYRSALAARIAQRIGLELNLNLETNYFGIADNQPNSEKRRILENTDRVFIMEEEMRFDIEKVLRFQGPIICLAIPDKKEIGESQIEKIVREKVFNDILIF